MRGVVYAAWEIILLLAIALLIGFILGWILRRVLYDTNVSRLEAQLQEARSESVALADSVAGYRSRIEELEEQLADQEQDPSPPAPPSKDEAIARVAEIAARTAGDGPVVDDDLEEIHGVGPKIAGLLRGMGITSFAQVAGFEGDDIAYVAAALEAFSGRIERDDWMASAAALHAEKYGSVS
jgi:predicted flap endonuclease-1-like 5' DNA nuclease